MTESSFGLDGAIVVTGAASGIGEGVAREAAERGLRLVLADLDEAGLGALSDDLATAGAEVLSRPVDVGDPAAVEDLAAAAFERFGRVRVLVNNAGIEATGAVWETSPETFERVVRVNLLGTFNGLRAFLPRLLEQGAPASVVNLASLASVISGPTLQAAYNASKHGVQALTETLYLELAQRGAPISVHIVNPGPVATRIFEGAAVEGEAAAAAHREFSAMVSTVGLTGREVGEIVLDGVEAGEFWICTHPSWHDAAAAQRAAMLTGRRAPSLPAFPEGERR